MTSASSRATALADTALARVQYVSFRIGDEEYGIDIMAVREIRAWSDTTTLPNSPDFVRGVINLRGTIVPIIDLRARFGGGMTQPTKTHVVVIVKIGPRTTGILVDAVSDILTVDRGEICPVPDLDRTVEDEYLDGILSVEERMVTLLALDRLFSPKALSSADEVARLPGPAQ